MAGRHRARNRSIQIIRTATVAAKDCQRATTTQFHVRLYFLYCLIDVRFLILVISFLVHRTVRRRAAKLDSPSPTESPVLHADSDQCSPTSAPTLTSNKYALCLFGIGRGEMINSCQWTLSSLLTIDLHI